jgi:hypothetical protein
MGYGMLSSNGAKGGLKNPDTMHFIFKATDGRIARVSGCYTGPVQPATRDSEMSCILRGTEGCSQGDYMDLRYAITDKTGEERIITWEHKLKHYFRFEGKSHHAGEYQNYLEYFADSIIEGFTASPDIKEGVGTIALLQDRAMAKRNLRAHGTGISARENNPLKFMPNATAALGDLLTREPRTGFLDPPQAVRAAHRDLQQHQVAMMAGMRAALLDLMMRLGPEAIEAGADPPQGLARTSRTLREAQLWHRLQQIHAQLIANLDDSFDAAFGREFLRAYEEQSGTTADAAPPTRVPPSR